MSDDKREKLREYLRNNRPKSKINLGNNSDIKENSNKNLEDDLNLDNSNLNNFQISHNKTNSHKRDYDKEPIVIKDYSYFFGVNGVFPLPPTIKFPTLSLFIIYPLKCN